MIDLGMNIMKHSFILERKDLTNILAFGNICMSGIARRVDPASAGFVVAINPGVLKTARMGVALLGHGRAWAFLLAQSLKLEGDFIMKQNRKASKQLQTIPTKNHLITFNFDGCDIRVVVDKSGNPWWIAVDVCNALNIVSVDKAFKTLEHGEKGIALMGSTFGGRHFAVNDIGLYQLVMQSRKPKARDFLRWLVVESFPDMGHLRAAI